jgi:hypothetical protein
MPDGVTLDERNMELLRDGSRQRRRGLELESGEATLELPDALDSSDKQSVGRWRAAGGDPTANFVCAKIKDSVHFWTDDETLADGKNDTRLILSNFITTGTQADLDNNPVTFSQGADFLVISGRFIETILVEYDATADNFTASAVSYLFRDYRGIDDGTSTVLSPVNLTSEHNYNLQIRGWPKGDITQYQSDKAAYPSKAMIWHKGYQRIDTTTGLEPTDGIKTWSSDKLIAEQFGHADAPMGALFLNPFDTTEAHDTAAALWGNIGFTDDAASPTMAITMTVDQAHTLIVNDTVVISGHEALFQYLDPEPGPPITREESFSLDGSYNVDAQTATTFTFDITLPVGFDGWNTRMFRNGTSFESGNDLPKSDGYTTNERFAVSTFHEGRLFSMGARHTALMDQVFFSKIVNNVSDAGKCYQDADPTNPDINSLLPTDGGVIDIPGMGIPLHAISEGGSLFIFAENGVYAISGGQRGFFTADGYSVNRIEGAPGCVAADGVVKTDAGMLYVSEAGLYLVSSVQQGFSFKLQAKNITRDTIQKLWNQLDSAVLGRMKLRYEDALQRVHVLYQSTKSIEVNRYDRELIFDIALAAWMPMQYPQASAGGFITDSFPVYLSTNAEEHGRMKYFVITNTRANLEICDKNQAGYDDWDDSQILPYLTAAYDNLKDFQRKKYAPVLHVWMRRTEGNFDGGAPPVATNVSSVLITARWDFTDNTTAGKSGTQFEAYKHLRAFTPAGASDPYDDGVPIIVTRNKLRGHGRVLHLRFDGAADKDFHLLGWNVLYKGKRRQ